MVKAWEAKNDQRVKRAAGLGLMAVSLAACGGSDEVVTPTVTIAQMIASDDLPASYNIAIATVNAGALTIAQFENVGEEALAALNVEAFEAALEAGTITVSYSIADTAANILAAGAAWFDDEAVVVTDATVTLTAANLAILEAIGATFAGDVTVSDTAANILASSADMSDAAVTVTGAAVTLSVAQLEALEDLGATFAGDVTVSDTAANILASSADMSDAAVTVTGAAVTLSVAQLEALEDLGATFAAAPSVSDTLDNVDGAELAGIVNLTVSIASPTAGADDFSAVIDATGTGTVTFDFADTDDTVTLTGSIDGFTTVAVRFGTVDLTGVTLDGSVDVITVSSGVILTADQFLALETGVTGGSADSTVQIVINDADEAADVIAAIANLGGTLDASNVEFVRGVESLLTDVAMDGLNAALADEMDQYASANALPAALADLNDAEADVVAHEEDLAEFYTTANEILSDYEDIYADGNTADGDADTAVIGTSAGIDAANDSAAGEFVGQNKPVEVVGLTATNFNALTDAQQDSLVGLARLNLQTAIDTAEVARDLAAEDLEFGVAELIADAELALAAKELADAALVLAEADLPGAVGAADGSLSSATNDVTFGISQGGPTSGTYVVDSQILGTTSVLTATNGVWSIATTDVALDTQTGVYTITVGAGSATIRAVELDALLVVLNAIDAATVAVAAADTALDAAVDAAIDAQEPTNTIDWDVTDTQVDLVNGEIVYGVVAMDTYVLNVGALDAAELALTDFNAAVTAWEATNALADELDALDTTGTELGLAVIEAQAAITNAVDDADAPGLGIDIITANQPGAVTFDDGTGAGAPSADDLYVFDAADGGDNVATQAAIETNFIAAGAFGADGTDRIYFGEETYTFVTLDEDADFAESVGSASALEIFAFEDDDGVTLYVETVATAGNGTTDADITEIFFDGLTLADMSFSSTTNILVSVESLV